MKMKLEKELQDRNIELEIEERRLNELNQKYSLLKQNANPVTVLKLHEDLVASHTEMVRMQRGGHESPNLGGGEPAKGNGLNRSNP